MKKILLADEDLNLATSLRSVLKMNHYQVMDLNNCTELLTQFQEFKPDLILMDVVYNSIKNGFELSRQIRSVSDTPILFITSCTDDEDFEQAFNIDYTDFIRKPYSITEVLKRVERLLHIDMPQVDCFELGHFTFFPLKRELICNCTKISLPNNEAEVLTLLCQHTGTFISRDIIALKVWNVSDPKLKEGSLNNILTNLRKYFHKDCNVEIEIETKTGLGVRIAVLITD